MKTETNTTGPETTEPTAAQSTLTKKQVKTYGPRSVTGYGPGAMITAKVSYDDQCCNGHNTFSITADVKSESGGAGGCLHEDVAQVFPELAPFIKWHLCSSDGPMHYVENAVYHAGNRDCHGLLAGEFQQHTSRGKHQAGGVEGVPHWELVIPAREALSQYTAEKPAPVVCEWKPAGRTGEGKARELDAARECAVWPEATDEQLCAEPAELRAALMARLPALLADFHRDVESLGFVW